MGQHQLLLLVATIIIAGLATIYGIYTFSESNARSNVDLLISDGMHIITDIQAWKTKPAQYGGGLDEADFSTVTFEKIGRTQGSSFSMGARGQLYFHERPIGCYILVANGTWAPEGGVALGVVSDYSVCRARRELAQNLVAVASVTGTNAEDITWDFFYDLPGSK